MLHKTTGHYGISEALGERPAITSIGRATFHPYISSFCVTEYFRAQYSGTPTLEKVGAHPKSFSIALYESSQHLRDNTVKSFDHSIALKPILASFCFFLCRETYTFL